MKLFHFVYENLSLESVANFIEELYLNLSHLKKDEKNYSAFFPK